VRGGRGSKGRGRRQCAATTHRPATAASPPSTPRPRGSRRRTGAVSRRPWLSTRLPPGSTVRRSRARRRTTVMLGAARSDGCADPLRRRRQIQRLGPRHRGWPPGRPTTTSRSRDSANGCPPVSAAGRAAPNGRRSPAWLSPRPEGHAPAGRGVDPADRRLGVSGPRARPQPWDCLSARGSCVRSPKRRRNDSYHRRRRKRRGCSSPHPARGRKRRCSRSCRGPTVPRGPARATTSRR